MNAFVNAFGINIPLTKAEHTSLSGEDKALFIYEKDTRAWTMKGCKNCGLRAEITSVDPSPQKTNHPEKDSRYELIFEVTLPKLLPQSKSLGGLTKRSEIDDACKKLDKMIRNIEETSGVNLLQKAKLSWVDLAKDVMTPNEFYSHEIIEAASNALDIYGYKKDSSFIIDTWEDEDYVVFVSNHVSGKLYNKT